MSRPPLEQRLAPFLERGLLPRVPNRWQIWQGTLEMTPFVLSPDVTSEDSYRDHVFAHPLVRQLFLIRLIGLDHLSTGTGLRVQLSSICAHLMLTWHQGMPSYDLQIVQTHEGGLAELRRLLEGALNPTTAEDRRTRRQADRLFPDPPAYFRLFLEPGGWIDRAAAFDYPTAAEEGTAMPEEFTSLTRFLSYCLTLPESVGEVGLHRVPGHLLRLGGRRFRSRTATSWPRTA